MSATDQVTLGAFEMVSFPDFKMGDLKAKIDTGAYTGALHCTKISEKQTPNGAVLVFSPFDHPERVIKEEEFVVNHVKSSNGNVEARYFITTNITIAGETYPILLSLADRSEMKWPVLIGRRFLRKHNFLVDVTKKPTVTLSEG
jgi:hypothetical protein